MTSDLEPRTITFKAAFWGYEEINDNTELIIHVGGKTKEGETVQCRILNFTPFVFLELPKRIQWTEAKCKMMFEHFQNTHKSDGPPLQWLLMDKFLLHYKRKAKMLCFSFPSHEASRKFAQKTHNVNHVVINGLGAFSKGEFKVHEQNIDPIMKFTASQSISLAGWITATETILPEYEGCSIEDRKFSIADIDLCASWNDVVPETKIDPALNLLVRYLCFDIECYSKNHNSRMPDGKIPENKIFHVGVVIANFGTPKNERRRILLTLGDPLPIKGVLIEKFKDERSLIIRFAALCNEENPDVYLGYNIMKFDWNYFIERARLLRVFEKFCQIGRIIGKKAVLKEPEWQSGAYGEQKFSFLDPYGQTNVDVLLEVERNYKFRNYQLNTVAEELTGQKKVDITPRQLFMIVQLTDEMTPVVAGLKGVVPKEKRIEIKRRIQDILPLRKSHGMVKDLRTELMNATRGEEFIHLVRKGYYLTGKYCIQDVDITIDVCEKLNLWTTMEELANCMCIPLSYLHTRGQQIKVLAQIYRETIANDIVIPYKGKKDGETVKYQGATVIEANPGDYENVVTFDFESLYPSMMIAYNICYTTILEDSDPTSDEVCHVLMWEDHSGCSHDPQKRKKKKEDVMCKSHRYRFKKMVIHPDGRREGEGLMSKLVRRLMVERKKDKKEMARLDAMLKMTRGDAKEKDIAFFKKMGWEIITPGTLTENQMFAAEIGVKVYNAKQLAKKVSANSVSPYTPIPCRLNGRFKYMTIEECSKGDWSKVNSGHQIASPLDGLEAWSDDGFTKVKQVIRHPQTGPLVRVTTGSGSVDCTKEHSLLLPSGIEASPNDIKVGDELMHRTMSDPIVLSFTLQYLRDNRTIVFKNVVECAEAYAYISQLGYPVKIFNDGVSYYLELLFKSLQNENIVISITELTDKYSYVYDIETENHHFAAGIGRLIVHNSAYGGLGAQLGFIPLIEGAASVTAMGRQILMKSIKYNLHANPGIPSKSDLGKAALVYGDTDSLLVRYIGLTTVESFEKGDRMSKQITHYLRCDFMGLDENYQINCPTDKLSYTLDKFPRDKLKGLSDSDLIYIHTYDANPINLQFENLYSRYLLLSKKRYVTFAVNREGVVTKSGEKGVLSARRDNSMWEHNTYIELYKAVLDNKTEDNILDILYKNVHKLFTRQVPDVDLIIYVAIKNLMRYAKKKEKKSGKTVIETVYIDEDGVPIKDPIDALDPRLVYPNYPQVLLALKMLRRGDELPPNTRLEFIYIEKDSYEYQGELAEDFTYFKENKASLNMRMNYLFYLEKGKIVNAVIELFGVKFPHEKIPHETFDEAVLKRIEGLDELQKHRLALVKTITKVVPDRKHIKDVVVGWEAICEKCEEGKACNAHSQNSKKDEAKKYSYKQLDAKVEHILASMRRKRNDPKLANEIDQKKHASLIKACLAHKSRDIIDRLYKSYGLRRRAVKRPTQTGEKLRLNTQVMMTSNFKTLKKDDIVFVHEVEVEMVEGYKSKKRCTYKLKLVGIDSESIVEGVPRTSFATFRLRDDNIMKDILLARKAYRSVIVQLDTLFCPLKFAGKKVVKKIEQVDVEDEVVVEE